MNLLLMYIYPYDLSDLTRLFLENILVFDKIKIFVIFIECFIGCIANIVSLIVWHSGTRSSKVSCSTYFKFLAVSDIFALLYMLIRGINDNLYLGLTDVFTGNVWCKISWTLYYFAPQLSAWIVVCLSVERTLSLCFPFKFRTQGSDRRAKIAFPICLVCLAGINSISLITTTETDGLPYVHYTM